MCYIISYGDQFYIFLIPQCALSVKFDHSLLEFLHWNISNVVLGIKCTIPNIYNNFFKKSTFFSFLIELQVYLGSLNLKVGWSLLNLICKLCLKDHLFLIIFALSFASSTRRTLINPLVIFRLLFNSWNLNDNFIFL